MNFNEYMQIEIENGSKEKVVNLKNIVKLYNDYEVALLDIMYEYKPFSINQLKANVSDIRKEAHDARFELNVEYDGLSNETDRRNLLTTTYNTVTRVQLSEFDIWNYQRTELDKIVANLYTQINRDDLRNRGGDLDIKTIIQLLNDALEGQRESIKHILSLQFNNTSGKLFITTDRYFTLPKFEIDENRNLIYLHLPYYIHSVELSAWLSNLTNLPKVITRKAIPLPYAPLVNRAAEYSMIDPISRIVGNLNVVENQYRHDGVNIFVYCDLIEYQIVGSINSPLLRLTSLDRSKKGINWRQFNELQYMPIKYHQFHNFTISVRGEKGESITSGKIYLTLHFRKRE